MGASLLPTPAAPARQENPVRRDVIRRAAAGVAIGLFGPVLQVITAAAFNRTPMSISAISPVTATGGYGKTVGSEHHVVADADAEAVWFLGTLALIRGVSRETGGALATVEFTHPPGFATALHVHHAADEAFYVLGGRMRGICGDQEWAAAAGAFVWLPLGIPHGYAVDGAEPLRTLAIALPGGFDRFVVEAGDPARERILPPPGPPDIARLDAVGLKYGIETVGPPVQFSATPTA